MMKAIEGDNNAGGTGIWSEIQHDMLELISKHLPLDDLYRLAGVCKQWQTITYNVMPRRYGSPCFVYYREDEPKKDTFFDPSSKRKLPFNAPMWLYKKYRTLYARDGWVLMSYVDEGDDYMEPYFVNPLTDDEIELPRLDGDLGYGFSFSGNPTSDDCVVLAIKFYDSDPWKKIVSWCRRGDAEWETRTEQNKIPFFTQEINPFYHRGCFYHVGRDGLIGRFDVRTPDDDNRWTVLPKPESFDVAACCVYLAESDDGGLLSVAFKLHSRQIRVYKLVDPSSNRWVEVEDIGGNLYLGRYSSMFAKVDGQESSNKVYLDRFDGQDFCSYTVGLDSGRYPRPYRPNKWVKEYKLGYWIDLDLSYPSPEELTWCRWWYE